VRPLTQMWGAGGGRVLRWGVGRGLGGAGAARGCIAASCSVSFAADPLLLVMHVSLRILLAADPLLLVMHVSLRILLAADPLLLVMHVLLNTNPHSSLVANPDSLRAARGSRAASWSGMHPPAVAP